MSAPAAGASLGHDPVTPTPPTTSGSPGSSSPSTARTSAPRTPPPRTRSPGTRPRPNGAHTLRAIARDAAGNTTTSAPVSVTVNNDITPPTVSVSAPAAGATVTGTTPSTPPPPTTSAWPGSSSPSTGPTSAPRTRAPPTRSRWNTTTATNGAHALRAIARDAAGNTTTSSPVSVTVSNTGTPPPAGLVAAYGFEETSGTAVTDSSGAGNNGTIGGGAARTAAGKIGRAIDFDGVNDLVAIPDANSLDLTTGMTLEAWVQPDTLSSWREVILKERPGDAHLLAVRQHQLQPAPVRHLHHRRRQERRDRARSSPPAPGPTWPPPTTAPTCASTRTGCS